MSKLLESLEDYFKSRRRSTSHKEKFFPTQSSAFVDYEKYQRLQGKCLRSAYYSCMGVEEDYNFSLSNELIKTAGKAFERTIIYALRAEYKLYDANVQFKLENYSIKGEVDALIYEDDIKVGLEIKTIGGNNQYAVDSIFGNSYLKAFPKWQNLFQTVIYCYAFRETIPYFLLMYVRRDTCETKIFKVSIDQVEDKIKCFIDGELVDTFCVDDILERYKLLKEYIDAEITPDREYQFIYEKEDIQDYLKVKYISKKQFEKYEKEPFGDFECRYCEYKTKCKEDD